MPNGFMADPPKNPKGLNMLPKPKVLVDPVPAGWGEGIGWVLVDPRLPSILWRTDWIIWLMSPVVWSLLPRLKLAALCTPFTSCGKTPGSWTL